ncbi:MAG TPA: tetratricopeptide repeat protein [Acidobacteriota bacterium]|nr:tetratricopeptide repeat protein [Acidobacteriota bacterium]
MDMGFRLKAAAVAASIALASPALFAQMASEALAKRKIIEVVCRSDAGQSYALYLPSAYSPEREWPILYCLDPGARGRVPVALFQDGAEKYGYIIVGSNNSRNRPFEICKTAMESVWNDTHARFTLSKKQVFGAGMSGGARSICSLAQLTGLLSGVIACAAGFSGSQVPRSVPYFFFGTAGTDDFNYPELRQLDRDLEKVGAVKRIVTFDGGHDWAPKAVCTQAIGWLELQSIKAGLRRRDESLIDSLFGEAVASVRAAEGDSAASYLLKKALAADFRGLRDTAVFEREADALASSGEVKRFFREEEETHLQQDRRGSELYSLWMMKQEGSLEETGLSSFAVELSNLRRQADASKDSGSRRVARRVLHGLYVHAAEQGRAELEKNNFTGAARLLELASAIRPDSPIAYYNLASAYARAGDKRRALDALKRAMEKGFKDGRRVLEDPAFGQLRNDPGLKKLLSRINQ